MIASVPNPKRAVEVSISILSVFVKSRQMIVAHKELSGGVARIESHLVEYDEHIIKLTKANKPLLKPEPHPMKSRLGLNTGKRFHIALGDVKTISTSASRQIEGRVHCTTL